jgi:hypothetical protein
VVLAAAVVVVPELLVPFEHATMRTEAAASTARRREVMTVSLTFPRLTAKDEGRMSW